MKSTQFFILLIAALFFISSDILAQPRMTLWEVAENHDHSNGEQAKIQYGCGSNYFLIHRGGQQEMHFTIRNDGDEMLLLKPLVMSLKGSPLIKMTQPDTDQLNPGEETHFKVMYTNEGAYIPNQMTDFKVMSNDGLNVVCGFRINIIRTDPSPGYCICEDGELMDQDDDATGFVLQPNQFLLANRFCEEGDVCPTDEQVTCFYLADGGSFTTQANDFVHFCPYYFPVQPGYCPCIFEENFNLTKEGEDPEWLQRDDINAREVECIGDEITFNLDTWFGDDGRNPIGFDVLPDQYIFTWCTSGDGVVTEIPVVNGYLSQATIEDWVPGEAIFVKIEDGEGCLSVASYFLENTHNNLSLDVVEGDCISGEITICTNNFGPLQEERNHINARAPFVWYTNGDGVLSDPFEMNDEQCITLYGAKPYDYVTIEDQADCSSSGTFFLAPYSFRPCPTARENIGLYGIALDDPCNCFDPLNILEGGFVELFHDVLSIDITDFNMSPPMAGVMVTVDPDENFLDENGAPFTDPIILFTDENGRVEYDFWHPPGVAATAVVSANGGSRVFISSICEVCPQSIPTMGQWGLIILGLCIGILGLVFFRSKKLNLNAG